MRIPLVKTAEGDLDYPVLLKYGGTLGTLDLLKTVQFPMIHTVNIDPELSQIKLVLPASYRWLQFDGTAARVDGEGDFVAGYLNYRTQQVQSLTQILRGKNYFSKTRASGNIKSLDAELQEVQKQAAGERSSNEQLRRNLDLNVRAIELASQQMAELEKEIEEVPDNREKLNAFYREQQNTLSRNSVTRLGTNFAVPAIQDQSTPAGEDKQRFDSRWFSGLGLGDRSDEGRPQAEAQKSRAVKRRYEDFGEVQNRPQSGLIAPEATSAAQNVFQVQPGKQGSVSGRYADDLGQKPGLTTQSQLNRAYEQKFEQQVEQRDMAGTEVRRARDESGTDGYAAVAGDKGIVAEGLVLGEPLAGLASLELEIPERGTAYYFTTPGKQVTITAKPMKNEILERAINFAWLVGIAAGLCIIFVVTRRLAQTRRGLVIGAVVLMLAGLTMLLLAILPLFGLILILGGVLVAVEAVSRRTALSV